MLTIAVRQVCTYLVSTTRFIGGRVAAMVSRAVQPTSTNEDERRRELVLNIILLLSLGLATVLYTITIYNRFMIQAESDLGYFPGIFILFIGFCLVLFNLSKHGYSKSASYTLILCYVIGALYTGWTLGASLPATLLLLALIIVITSVLVGSTVGFVTVALVIAMLVILSLHETVITNLPYWRYEQITMTDVVAYSALLLFVGFISWLSNRELDRSLSRARNSEKQLENERNALEQRISERTEEFIYSEKARMEELARIAEFGKLSRGLFHDLINPLTAVSLQMERLSDKEIDVSEAKEIVDKAVKATRRMRTFMENIRHCFDEPAKTSESWPAGQRFTEMTTDLQSELRIVIDMLAYKARLANIRVIIKNPTKVTFRAHPLRINQLFLNLISNALDSYEERSRNRLVEIWIKDEDERATIMVRDFGRGIPEEHRNKLFTMSFSTKSGGTGIGLLTIKSIVSELGGTISVESKLGHGTTFSVMIPK